MTHCPTQCPKQCRPQCTQRNATQRNERTGRLRETINRTFLNARENPKPPISANFAKPQHDHRQPLRGGETPNQRNAKGQQMNQDPACHWTSNTTPRALTGRHLPHCTQTCRGCQPCPHLHCIICDRQHVTQHTCPTCIADTRNTLNDIRTLVKHLPAQAYFGATTNGHAGIRLNADAPIPGGDALTLLAPHSPGTEAQRLSDTHHHWWDNQPTDPEPPLALLASWEDDWRHTRGQPAGTRATIANTTEYLNRHLAWAAQHHDAFDTFVTELNACRTRLENVTHTGDRDDPGAPCFTCNKPLTRQWGDTAEDDRWHCQHCDTWIHPHDYARNVAQQARRNATALTATDMETEHHINPTDLRHWARTHNSRGNPIEPRVHTRGRNHNGRLLYDVAEALAQRNQQHADNDTTTPNPEWSTI